MISLHSMPYSQSRLENVLEILDQEGCIALTGVLSKHRLELLQSEMKKGFSKVPSCQGNFFGFATKRISSVIETSKIARELAVDPLVLSVMDNFLLKSCRQYQINLTQGIKIYPGEPAQIIHTDDLMFPFELPVRGDQKMINCMWSLDDFTQENGGTLLVPGSHKWPRDRQPEPSEIVAAEMPAGSLLIYFGSLLHAGGANRSKVTRAGLVLSYCLGWLRQAENHYLAVKPETLRTLPNILQRLLGYFVHEPNLGAVDGRDPIEIIGTGTSGKRFEEFIPAEFQPVMEEYRNNQILKSA